MDRDIDKSEAEWKQALTPDQFEVTRRKGTERPFSGEYYDCKDAGTYRCVCCGEPLFSSTDKYDSGSGWPSFTAPLKKGMVEEQFDSSHGMRRTEVLCQRCGAHLGHVFDDGPGPGGQRYCINSLSLDLERDEE